MPFTEYRQVFISDAVAVVGNLDELEASVLDDDVDGSGSGVEAVLDELFHGGVRALDHLSGGDPVHDGWI